jgi:hypothetical protein
MLALPVLTADVAGVTGVAADVAPPPPSSRRALLATDFDALDGVTFVAPGLSLASFTPMRVRDNVDPSIGDGAGVGAELGVQRGLHDRWRVGAEAEWSRVERTRFGASVGVGWNVVELWAGAQRALATGTASTDLIAQWQLVVDARMNLGVVAFSAIAFASLDHVSDRSFSGSGAMIALRVRLPLVVAAP